MPVWICVCGCLCVVVLESCIKDWLAHIVVLVGGTSALPQRHHRTFHASEAVLWTTSKIMRNEVLIVAPVGYWWGGVG